MIINSIYKLLNATIGSNLEALFAGKTPKIKPIDPEMIMVEKVLKNDIQFYLQSIFLNYIKIY